MSIMTLVDTGRYDEIGMRGRKGQLVDISPPKPDSRSIPPYSPILPDDIGLHSFVDGAHSLPMAQVTATEPLPRSVNGVQSGG